jgi:hypothetical protein
MANLWFVNTILTIFVLKAANTPTKAKTNSDGICIRLVTMIDRDSPGASLLEK